MQRVLVATTNKDKYSTVSKIFKRTIFPDSEYEIVCLTKEMNIPDEKECGSNIERARAKALNAFNHLKAYNFDYIVGLDDAIVIRGKVEPNIKEYLNKIIYENYIEDGEVIAFNKAYCIIDKEANIYEIALEIPEIYHSLKDNFTIEEHTYPLAHVMYPIGYNVPVCELSDEESINYDLKYLKEGLMSLKIKKN